MDDVLFTLDDLKGAFYLFFIGLEISSISFFAEILASRYKLVYT